MESVLTTICKARLSIADIDRQYYQSHQFTLAQQSSETIVKSMMRLVAYIYNANETLTIRKQDWHKDQPELIEQSDDNEIKLWIDLGEPNIKRIKKACRLSKKVIIYTYKNNSEQWWQKNKGKLNHFQNLKVFAIDTNELESLNNKRISLNCTLQDGDLQITNGDHNLMIERQRLM